jgi:hypothetical protein
LRVRIEQTKISNAATQKINKSQFATPNNWAF